MRTKQLIASHKYAMDEARGKTAESVSWVDRVEGDKPALIDTQLTQQLTPIDTKSLNNIQNDSVHINKLAAVKASGCRCVVM